MKTFAKYKFTKDWTAQRIGNDWLEVTNEYQQFTPSGLNNYVVIGGVGVKARFCEIIQVFEK